MVKTIRGNTKYIEHFFGPKRSAKKPPGIAAERQPIANMDPTQDPSEFLIWKEFVELLSSNNWGKTGDVQATVAPNVIGPRHAENLEKYL